MNAEKMMAGFLGGIPQGLYHIKADEERFAKTSPFSHIIQLYGWGRYAWPLHPDASTDMRGREGFFIHGGSDFGSAGCIDLQYKDTVFRDYFQKTKQSTICNYYSEDYIIGNFQEKVSCFMKNLTIKTIAEMAGVSVATVSKVINNSGNISDATKNKVMSIIQQNHFVPQQRKQKGNSLGVIMQPFENVPFPSSFDSMVFDGICREAFAHGFDVTVINGKKIAEMNPYELHCYFLSNSLTGAILIGATANEQFKDLFLKSDILFISVGEVKDASFVISKTGESTASMIDYMICLGHRKIAYLGLTTNVIPGHLERFNAYKKILAANKIPLNRDYIFNLPNAEHLTILNALQRLLARHDPPDALFFETESFSKTIFLLQQLKIRVPQDLSVAGFYCSDDPVCGMRPSAIIQPEEKLGRSAVEHLLRQLNSNTPVELKIKLDCQIIYGETIEKK